MKAAELCKSKENGLQDRNARVFVMLRKKFSQLEDEKLLAIILSSGWGKGVGRTGGVAGIVGRF